MTPIPLIKTTFYEIWDLDLYPVQRQLKESIRGSSSQRFRPLARLVLLFGL
jgi:hypothetical protein